MLGLGLRPLNAGHGLCVDDCCLGLVGGAVVDFWLGSEKAIVV